jgi:hypothetical protein
VIGALLFMSDEGKEIKANYTRQKEDFKDKNHSP